MRIYHRKVDYISEPENPLMQIPIKAISKIAQTIEPHYLGLTTEEQKTFLKTAFALRFKKDFSYVYLDNYNNNGMDDAWLTVAKQGNLTLDPNTNVLADFYDSMERKTFGTEQEYNSRTKEQELFDQKIEHFFGTARPDAKKLKEHLRTKMIIFGHPDDQMRDTLVQMFKLMGDQGEKWMQYDLDQTYIDINDAEIQNQPVPGFKN